MTERELEIIESRLIDKVDDIIADLTEEDGKTLIEMLIDSLSSILN